MLNCASILFVMATAAATSPRDRSDNNDDQFCRKVLNVSVSEMKVGEEKQVEWCTYGVRIVRRSEKSVEELSHTGELVQGELSVGSKRPPHENARGQV